MRLARKIERGLALEPKANRSSHGPDHANNLMDLPAASRILDGHEVHDFANALLAQEPRHEHVRIRQVHLLGRGS